MAFPRMDQEVRCDAIFADLEKLYKKAEKSKQPDKIHAMLKDANNKLKEAKALIKDFEREARLDGMPVDEMKERSKALIHLLNGYIATKKNLSSAGNPDIENGGAAGGEQSLDGMSTQQLMTRGRKDIKETDDTLARTERIVADTLQIGTGTAEELKKQGQQLDKLVDDLNEIEMDMKKATKIIRDITRGLLTDKCIAFLMFLIAVAVVVIIVLKVIKPNKKKIAAAAAPALNVTLGAINGVADKASDAINGRRMLLHALQFLAATSDEDYEG